MTIYEELELVEVCPFVAKASCGFNKGLDVLHNFPFIRTAGKSVGHGIVLQNYSIVFAHS